MKRLRSTLILLALLALASIPASGADGAGQARKIRVLLIYGGHDFQTNQFLEVFKDNPEITMESAELPKAQDWFKSDKAGRYDVLVFYDMWQTISETAKADLIDRLEESKGLVALHHCLASYPNWDEYAKIIGGRYHQQKWSENGVEKPASTYKHDVDFEVHVADPDHPVTRGIRDFTIHDETYGRFEVKPGVHVLLSTDEPTSGKNIAWAKRHGPARVVYIQLGHDEQAYRNENYQRLLAQAIRWVANRGER